MVWYVIGHHAGNRWCTQTCTQQYDVPNIEQWTGWGATACDVSGEVEYTSTVVYCSVCVHNQRKNSTPRVTLEPKEAKSQQTIKRHHRQ